MNITKNAGAMRSMDSMGNKEQMVENVSCYENLANAIVLQAARDYREMLVVLARNPDNKDALRELRSLEKFFHSKWYATLTNVPCKVIIKGVREQARIEVIYQDYKKLLSMIKKFSKEAKQLRAEAVELREKIVEPHGDEIANTEITEFTESAAITEPIESVDVTDSTEPTEGTESTVPTLEELAVEKEIEAEDLEEKISRMREEVKVLEGKLPKEKLDKLRKAKKSPNAPIYDEQNSADK